MHTFLDAFDTILFDLDGVIYVGEHALPGAPESLARLRRAGKHIRFLTNDPLPTREDVMRRLAGHDIDAALNEIVTSGWATANWLREQKVGSARVIGSEGLKTEISRAGVAVSHPGRNVDAVVIGCDENTGYADIREASRLIRNGAAYVATNDDATFPTPDGPAPATGAIVAAVTVAAGREPYIVGKPHPHMFRAALGTLPASRALMIGDNPATDILGAECMGIAALLLSHNGGSNTDARPRGDHVISTLLELFD